MSDETPDTPEASAPQPPRKPTQAELAAKRLADAESRELARIEKELDEVESYRMPLMEHLIELKDRVLYSVVAMVIGAAIGLYFARDVYDFLIAPFVVAVAKVEGVEGGLAIVNSPFEGITTYLKVGVLSGAVLASPVISYQIWQFIAPGLYKTERRIVLPLTVSSSALFLAGGAFCYYAIFPYAFPFMIEVLGLDLNLSAAGYLSSVITLMLVFGVCFQLPVASFFLSRIGLIDHKDLSGSFRYAVVAIFFMSAVITPPDPVTQILLAVPMIVLYGVSIVLAWLFSTKTRVETPAAA